MIMGKPSDEFLDRVKKEYDKSGSYAAVAKKMKRDPRTIKRILEADKRTHTASAATSKQPKHDNGSSTPKPPSSEVNIATTDRANEHNQALGNLVEQAKSEMRAEVDSKFAEIRSAFATELAEQMSRLETKLEQVIGEQPNGGGDGVLRATMSGMNLQIPGNPVTVEVLPTTQMYYSIIQQVASQHGEKPPTFSEFINTTVAEWFERRGYRIGLYRGTFQPAGWPAQ
jgi:hypothetical protein